VITFSIVIPTYNAAATIANTVQSCLQQSYPPHEIIVVDDASTDHTLACLHPFLSKIKLLQHPVNKGVSAARNYGWNSATGRYVLFLDSDDTFHPHKLAILQQVLAQHPEVQFLHHPYTLSKLADIDQVANYQPVKKSFTSLLLRNTVASPCMCVARSINIRFNEQLRYCEDHDFVLRCTWHHDCYYIPAVLSRLDHAILSGSGLSAQRRLMRQGELRMYSRLGHLNPLLIPVIPFLYLWSILKHIRRSLIS
jgi:teichuronic acid biosynthesis glycosyltransferase TuaG